MKNIGQQLKEAREKKGLSIQDAAVATKINNKTIQALEDGDVANLPAKPFLRGFVQTYARYLDLNVDEIMKKFLEVHGSTKPKTATEDQLGLAQESHEEVQRKVNFYKKIASAVAALIAITLIFIILKVVGKYEQESKVAREQKDIVKSQLATAPVETSSSSVVATVTVPSGTPTTGPVAPAIPDAKKDESVKAAENLKAQEEQKKLDAEKKAEEAKKLEEQKKAEAKKLEDQKVADAKALADQAKLDEQKKQEAAKKLEETKKLEEQKRLEAAKKADEIKKLDGPKKTEEAPKKTAKPQELIIEALDVVEIRYQKDAEGEKTIRLKPEQILTIKADAKVAVSINDGGAVNVIHNGQDRGVPGNLGQPSKLNFP